MFFTLTHLFYKITILVFLSVFLSVSEASPESDSKSDPKEDTKKSCGITPTNISKKTKQISGIKVQCQKDYERVQSYCTEKGLAAIQMISMGGQAVANAVNILKSDGKPGSAKKTMKVSKKLSYGLGALNTGIGVKCLANINSCSNSCGSAEKTKECLQTVKETAEQTSAISPSARAIYSTAISSAEKFIAKLDKVDGHSLKCKRLKTNAYAALAQGALHGATGLIQAKMEENMGRATDTDADDSDNNDSEAFNPPEPNPLETPTLSGEPSVNINDTPEDTSAGQLAGSQISSKSATESDGDLNDDFDDGYRDMDSVSDSTGKDFSGGTYGGSGSPSSGGSIGNIPFNTGESDSPVEEDEEDEWNENNEYGGEASFSGSGFSGGNGGGSGSYGDDNSGYYESSGENPDGDDLDLEEKKKDEEMEQLRKSIGGKHESIFEKASKILANYCMEGPQKCE